MILVDTSVWIDHLRHGNETLKSLLTQQRVYMHSMVIGELACGNLHNRDQFAGTLERPSRGSGGES